MITDQSCTSRKSAKAERQSRELVNGKRWGRVNTSPSLNVVLALLYQDRSAATRGARLVQRFARSCDASPRSCLGSRVGANAAHDEAPPTRARERISPLSFRARFQYLLSCRGVFRILRSIFGHREFSVLFCCRYIRKPRKRSTLGRSNLGW
jgi:hypothetical protein